MPADLRVLVMDRTQWLEAALDDMLPRREDKRRGGRDCFPLELFSIMKAPRRKPDLPRT